MIDIELFRKDPKIYDAEIKKRGMKIDISLGISLDSEKRKLTFKVDELRAKKNDASKIIPTLKGGDKTKVIAEMKEINSELKKFEDKLEKLEKQYKIHFSSYPNLTHETTPVGPDESGNLVHSTNGEKPEFNFEPKNHI
ncbi:MAG: serine--tRNA ligase, partial [Actinomycetia bacterium]|nr:serine--tRNA ligase [Actinomycetes bacterium]